MHSVQWVPAGARVDAVDGAGRTALVRAAENGQLEVVKALVRRGADVNRATHLGDTALMGAAYHGHAAVVRWLVEEAGVELGLRNAEGESALDLAEDPAVARQLAHPPARRQRPAHRLAELGDARGLEVCVRRGGEPDARGLQGETPLMCACLNGREDCATWLVRQGEADPHARDDAGRTALMGAARGGHLGLVQLLARDCQADLLAQDAEHGLTAAQWAQLGGHAQVARWLAAEGGASPSVAALERLAVDGEGAPAGAGAEGVSGAGGAVGLSPAPLLALCVHAVVLHALPSEDLPPDLGDLCAAHRSSVAQSGLRQTQAEAEGEPVDPWEEAMGMVETYEEWEARLSREAQLFLSMRRTSARAHIVRACANPKFSHLISDT